MALHFSSAYPAWLSQPSILHNVLNNSFAPLKDVPTSLSFAESSAFMAGLRQALYWRKRLASSVTTHSVIFACLGVEGLSSPNVADVFRALSNVENISGPVEVYRAFNSPFIGLSFADSSSASIFRTLCNSFQDHFIVHVSPSDSDTFIFKLIGLPPLFPDNRIHHFLTKHTASHAFTRELFTIDPHLNIPLNSITGKLKLKPNHRVSDLPHLIPLPSPYLGNALLIIHGRQSLCLKCGSVGHVRRHCSSSRCSSCKRFHLSTSSCSTSLTSMDLSFQQDWQLDESLSLSHPSDTTLPSAIAMECDRTRESFPPKLSPASTSSPTFASIVSTHHCHNNHTVSQSSASTSINSAISNITMPQHEPPLASNVSSHPTDSSTTMSHLHKSPHHDKHQSILDTAFSAKKSSLAAKRSRSSSSSVSSAKHRHASSKPQSSSIKKPISNQTNHINLDNSSPINSNKDSTSFTPSFAWGDRMEEELALNASGDPASYSSNSTIIDHSSSIHINPVDIPLIMPPSSLDIVDHTLNNFTQLPNHTSSAHDAKSQHSISSHNSSQLLSDSEPDSLDSYDDNKYHSEATDNIISLKGLPHPSSTRYIRDFIGLPHPSHIIVVGEEYDPPDPHLILFFRQHIDFSHVISKDGTWHKENIISAHLRRKGKEAPI